MTKVALRSVLDFLHSQEGQSALAPLRKRIDESGSSSEQFRVDYFDEPPAPPAPLKLPNDGFERAVLQWLFERNVHGSEARAALPQAVVSVLEAFGSAVDVGQVSTVLGAHAASLVRSAPPQPSAAKFRHLEERTIALLAESNDFDFMPRMPVLSELERNVTAETFRGWKMASVQHLLPSTLHLYEAFERGGMKRDDIWALGKPYSTNEDTFERMRGMGFRMQEESRRNGRPVKHTGDFQGLQKELRAEIEKHGSFDAAQSARRARMADSGEQTKEAAKRMLSEMFAGVDPNAETKPRFLLLDDGGKLLVALHEYFAEYAHLCVGVEQTDRGIQLLETLELRCPVVNMARSTAKKLMESPAIGEAVVFATLHQLKECHIALDVDPRIATIIGYGAVGKAAADSLQRRGFVVHVYDTDAEKMAQARANGCAATTREDALANAHLLISATGRTTITEAEYDLLPDGAVMVNAASGNHELGTHRPSTLGVFDAFDPLLKIDPQGMVSNTFRGLPLRLGDLQARDQMMHQVVRTEGGKRQLILRSGNVVNLGLGLPPEYVQLTLGLLFGSCAQACTTKASSGLVPLDDGLQNFLVRRTRKHLGSLTLETPDFQRVEAWTV